MIKIIVDFVSAKISDVSEISKDFDDSSFLTACLADSCGTPVLILPTAVFVKFAQLMLTFEDLGTEYDSFHSACKVLIDELRFLSMAEVFMSLVVTFFLDFNIWIEATRFGWNNYLFWDGWTIYQCLIYRFFSML